MSDGYRAKRWRARVNHYGRPVELGMYETWRQAADAEHVYRVEHGLKGRSQRSTLRHPTFG